MAVYKCKICGGNLKIEAGMTVCKCEYCGTMQTIPFPSKSENKVFPKVYPEAGTPLKEEKVETQKANATSTQSEVSTFVDSSGGQANESDIGKTQRQHSKWVWIALAGAFSVVLGVSYIESAVIQPQNNYDKAIQYMENQDYEAAINLFEDNLEYKDSATQLLNCRVALAEYYLAQNDFENAETILSEMENDTSLVSKEQQSAIAGKVEQKRQEIQNNKVEIEISNIRDSNMHDIVEFGIYGEKAIEWIILDKQDDRVFLTTRDVLLSDEVQDSGNREHIRWGNCTLRTLWANGEFYEKSFSDAERAHIQLTHLSNDGYTNATWSEPSIHLEAEETDDYIFLLSVDEVSNYISDATDVVDNEYIESYITRTPVTDRGEFAYVYNGEIHIEDGGAYALWPQGIRPAMWISVS